MRSLKMNLRQLFISTILLAASCPFGALAAKLEGGTSGGGGTLIYPSKQEVKEAIDNIYSGFAEGRIPPIKVALSGLESKKNEVRDPVIKKVLANFFRVAPHSNYSAVERVLQNTEYDKVNGPCYDKHNQPRAAAVVGAQLGRGFPQSTEDLDDGAPGLYAKLCYSVGEFTKVPRANLQQNLIALTIHELSHLFGYDEAVAVKIQDYLLEGGRGLLNDRLDPLDYTHYYSVELQKAVEVLRQEISEKKNDRSICARIGSLVQLDDQFETLLGDANAQATLNPNRPNRASDKALSFGRELTLDIYPLYGYCGIADEEYVWFTRITELYVAEGNRTELAQRLKVIAAKIKKIQKLLNVKVEDWPTSSSLSN